MHRAKAFSVSQMTLPVSRLGVGKRLGGDTAGTTDQKDIPYHMMSHSAIKAGGGRKGKTFGVMAFVFPSNSYAWWSPVFLETQKEYYGNYLCIIPL